MDKCDRKLPTDSSESKAAQKGSERNIRSAKLIVETFKRFLSRQKKTTDPVTRFTTLINILLLNLDLSNSILQGFALDELTSSESESESLQENLTEMFDGLQCEFTDLLDWINKQRSSGTETSSKSSPTQWIDR